MPVLIKNIDPELYTRFKAQVIAKGLKIDEAFTEAVKLWLSSADNLTPRECKQEKNYNTFRIMERTLKRDYPNKWVSIVNGKIAATANSKEELLETLKSIKKNDDPALFFQVGSTFRRVTFGIRKKTIE